MNTSVRLAVLLPIWGLILPASELETGPKVDHDQGDAALLKAVTLAPGYQPAVWATGTQVVNPVSIDLDEQGRLYAAETARWRKGGVIDVREMMFLYADDLACRTVADRQAMIDKWLGKFPAGFFTTESERIRLLTDPARSGKATTSTVWADGFKDAVDGPAAGILAWNGTVYFADIPRVYALRDHSGTGVADQRQVLAEGFGVRFSISGHDLHGLVMGPDGRLYFSLGDRGYDLTTGDGRHVGEPRRGAVFRCEPDGSRLEVFFRGLRNPQDLAFNADGDLFTVDNNADMGDLCRVEYLLEGGDGGWDHGWQLLGNDSFARAVGLNGRQPDPWMDEGLWKATSPAQPAWVLPPAGHLTAGPSGVAYCPSGNFGPDLVDRFLVCDFTGGPSSGVRTFQVVPAGAGFTLPEANKGKLIWGLPPTDVVFGYDQRIYVADWISGWTTNTHGRIVTVAETAPGQRQETAKSVAALVASGIATRPVGELTTLLDHDDQRVRQRAQFALVDAGAAGRQALEQTAARGPSVRARRHAVWGLGQLARREAGAAAPLVALLGDPEPRLREQAAKMLGEVPASAAPTVIPALLPLLTDASPRARAFAAIALGRLKALAALPGLLALVRANDDADPFLRHAAVMGLDGCADAAALSALARDPSPAVRMAAVLSLRHRGDAACAAFLADPAVLVRAEAIRAVYDLGLPATMPALIAQLDQPLAPGLPQGAERLTYLRLISAAQRWGDAAVPVKLARFAAGTVPPGEVRAAALQAIATWTKTPAIDPLLGFARPAAVHATEPDPAPLKEPILALVAREDEQLLGIAVKLAQAYGYGLPDRALLDILSAPTWAAEVRTEALNQLVQRQAPGLTAVLPGLLHDGDGELRSAAFTALLALDRTAGLAAASTLLDDDGQADPRIQVLTDKTDQGWEALRMAAPDPASDLARGRPVQVVPGFLPPTGLAAGTLTREGLLPALTDGTLPQTLDDPAQVVAFPGNEARFVLDLRQPTAIARVDTFSGQEGPGAPQQYVLWASADPVMPEAGGANPGRTWTRLAKVTTHGEGGRHASTVTEAVHGLGTWRWLMWQSLHQGTAFTEVAVYAAGNSPVGLVASTTDRTTGTWDTLATGGPAAPGSATVAATAHVVPGFAVPDAQAVSATGALPRLFTGDLPTSADDTGHGTGFDGAEARFLIDLHGSVELARIAAYSWQPAKRSAHACTVWASPAETAPEAGLKTAKDLEAAGWRRLGSADTRAQEPGGKHASCLQGIGASLGRWRWLLWQIPDKRSDTALARIDLWPAGSAMPTLRQPLGQATITGKRRVLAALGGLDDPQAAVLLGTWLDRLLAGTVPAALHLELTAAAAASKDPVVAAKLAAWQAKLDANDPLAPFRVALQGGDTTKGQDVFRFHLAQCIKCHSVNHEGGDAGPDLKGVGSRLGREEILQSLIEPNAVVAAGYGQGSVTLKDGTSVEGAFVSQTPATTEVKTADGTVRVLHAEQIQSCTPPISSMPPMGYLLQPAELRDLIAYLSSLH